MITERQRLMGILSELIKEALKTGPTRLNTDVVEEADRVQITIRHNGKALTADQTQAIKKVLDQPRHDEVEFYYHELLGQSFHGPCYSLVGKMVDYSKVQSTPDETVIEVYRLKR